jgi:hypothetical protein
MVSRQKARARKPVDAISGRGLGMCTIQTAIQQVDSCHWPELDALRDGDRIAAAHRKAGGGGGVSEIREGGEDSQWQKREDLAVRLLFTFEWKTLL